MRLTADPTKLMILGCAALSALGWIAAYEAGLLTTASRVAVYLLAHLILAFDVIDFIIRLWLRKIHGAAQVGPSVDLALPEISNAERAFGLAPYALIASIHNEARDIDRFLKVLLPFKDVVWLIDDASGDTTLLRLRREGWNCVAGGINRKKPAALAHLLSTLPKEIQTVLVMDPDVRWVVPPGSERENLERIISDLQRSGAAACTPSVRAHPGNWLEDCQGLEYALSCNLGRKCLRDLVCTSGVAIYQRAALEKVLPTHSMSVYAEDFENSVLLLAAGERIYYDDRFVIETHAKRSVRALFSQRVGWSFGAIKVMLERWPQFLQIGARSPLGAYQYLLYLMVGGLLLLPLKLASMVVLVLGMLHAADDLLMAGFFHDQGLVAPMLFASWYLKSTAVVLLVCALALPRGERMRHLPVMPFYAFYTVLHYIPLTIGYLNLLTLKLFGRRVYADHFDHQPKLMGRAATPKPARPA